MQAYGENLWLFYLYTQTLIGGQWSDSRLGRLIPRKETKLCPLNIILYGYQMTGLGTFRERTTSLAGHRIPDQVALKLVTIVTELSRLPMDV
jgi:hypothetical protein